ncbi:MAG: NADP-dependent glyceraldehyde-3-phosphate dehydrogenase [Pseudomonadota bacterium]
MSITEQIANLFPRANEVPQEHRLPSLLEQREILIDGVLERWEGATEPVYAAVCQRDGDAHTRVHLGSTPRMDAAASMRALDAACRAYDHGRGRWPTLSVSERIACVEDFAFRMQEQRATVVRLLMWEIGKSYSDSCKEFDRTLVYIRDTVEACKQLDRSGSRFEIVDGVMAQIRRAPLGVVLCMGPYNYPLNETFTTLIPALIMGNTVVFKPAKYGVLLNQPLLACFRDAFPAGVVNSVYGDGSTVIGPLMTSGKVDCLAFIGSSKVADILKDQHPAPHRLRSVLGLGAKNPAIVLPDADLDVAVQECTLGALSFNGQRCTGLKLMWVHRSIAEEFARRLASSVGALAFGVPWTNGVKLTPLPDPHKPAYLAELVADATNQGARVLNEGGGTVHHSYFHPAVVYPVTASMKLHHVEQFGPAVPIAVYDDISEPTRWVVESPYGQQASVFGRDPGTIAELIDPLVNQVSRVNLNSQCQRGPDVFPFTGRKDSAEGTLSVSDALRVFGIRTMVAAKVSDDNKALVTDIVRHRRSAFLSTDFIL